MWKTAGDQLLWWKSVLSFTTVPQMLEACIYAQAVEPRFKPRLSGILSNPFEDFQEKPLLGQIIGIYRSDHTYGEPQNPRCEALVEPLLSRVMVCLATLDNIFQSIGHCTRFTFSMHREAGFFAFNGDCSQSGREPARRPVPVMRARRVA